ncbi:TPA: hypothetical protein DEP58_00360 [Patescibacteria group bacterium]|nr:MAG: hypothetical protein UU98_C0016G0016 [Parcubacteria group bacterium GW2011_GWD2_42_14]HCC04740.1 hypothetical protein [Patescibacteria group bacterium]
MHRVLLISTSVVLAVGSIVWLVYKSETSPTYIETQEYTPASESVSTSSPLSPYSTSSPKENTSTTTSIPRNGGEKTDTRKAVSNTQTEDSKPNEQIQTFLYTFNVTEILEESGSSNLSSSQYFWLNSGAKLVISEGIGSTIRGALAIEDPWRRTYAETNPLDTDKGLFPQNLFRLITQSVWENVDQELEFSIQKVNALNTSDRDAFSGIFLMSRYVNSDTLYYAGIRMDGKAVIKKKYRGVYYTLAEAQLFTSPTPYDRVRFPNLIPTNTWYRMESQTITMSSGTVQIRLSFAYSLSEPLETILITTDTGIFWPPITTKGHTGIRTDYADVLFDNYKITTLVTSI